MAPSEVASTEDRAPPILPVGKGALVVRRGEAGTENGSGPLRDPSDGGPNVPAIDRFAGYRARAMQVASTTQPGEATDADTVAVGVFDGDDPPPQAPAELGELFASGEARRSFKALALTHAGGKRWLVV